MTSKVKIAIDAWRLAEAQAREAEALLSSACDDYMRDRSRKASPELVRIAARSRSRANSLLTVAVGMLGKPKNP